MIILHPLPVISSYRHKIPKHARRNKDIDLSQITAGQVKIEARRILSGGLPARIWRVLDLLATGGVLDLKHLNIPRRTLGHWSQQRLFERIPVGPDELKKVYASLGLDGKHPDLYTLGSIGIEIAAMRHDIAPPSGYQGYFLMRILHDVVANEIVLYLADVLGKQGWTVEWLGKYEGTLTDKNQKTILEPDALIRFRKDGEERAFLLEYHNEDKQARAAMKVEKYEAAFNDGNWREQWEVDKFPPVLVVFWQPIVGTGYQNATRAKKLNCTFYGKTLKAVLDGKLDEWTNVNNGKKENILPQ
jgi:hypothetical protein